MTEGNMSGADPMSDTLDFVKRLWSGMNVPGMPAMAAPTLSIEDLEQKITDLKAVESWLSVNMNMLRNTIQAMEVQRATIGALQSMGAAFQSAMGGGAEEKFAAAFWSALQPTQASPATAAEREPAGAPPTPKATVSAPAELAAQMTSPAAWWGILQDQFKQAVSSTITAPEAKATEAAVQSQAAPPKPAAAKSSPAGRKRKPAPKA